MISKGRKGEGIYDYVIASLSAQVGSQYCSCVLQMLHNILTLYNIIIVFRKDNIV